MASYLSQRLLLMIPSLIGTTVLTFVLLRVFLPADAIDVILGEYGANNPELRASIEKDLGMNSSLVDQYLEWVGVAWFYGGDTGILEGTTMTRLFARAQQAGWATAVTPGTVDDLHAADAVWLVSGVRGAATVHTLDGKRRGDAGLSDRIRELLAR